MRGNEINELKADRRDKANSIFNLDPTPLNAKMVYTTATQSGMSNAESRQVMAGQWNNLSDEDFRAMGEMPFGPNNIAFKDQYPEEWQKLLISVMDLLMINLELISLK